MSDEYVTLMEERPELFQNSPEKGSIKIVKDQEQIARIEKKMGDETGIMYQDSYIMLIKDAVCYPDGTCGMYIRIVYTEKNPGVTVIPFRENKILFLKHFRHGTRKTYLELPRGFGESGSGKENIEREMLEETGYRVTEIQRIGVTAPDSGLIAGEIQVYKAKIIIGEKAQETDSRESICGMEWMDEGQIREAVREGRITDGISLSALMILFSKNLDFSV